MAKRKIIHIDQDKCNGCGLCIPNCPEGALQMIDGKARLISDLFCDGLGACIGHCPEGAITIEEREARGYNEKRVMENIVKQGRNVIKAHLKHLEDHREGGYLKEAIDFLRERGIEVPDSADEAAAGHIHTRSPFECPGSKVMEFGGKGKTAGEQKDTPLQAKGVSYLRQWPIQIMLVPVFAPYLKGADLLVAADCVPFAYPNFHRELLKDKALLVGCPKLDDIDHYRDKFTQILKNNDPKSITYAHMEVPCCSGMIGAIKAAITESGKNVVFKDVTIGIKGERLR